MKPALFDDDETTCGRRRYFMSWQHYLRTPTPFNVLATPTLLDDNRKKSIIQRPDGGRLVHYDRRSSLNDVMFGYLSLSRFVLHKIFQLCPFDFVLFDI